MRTPQPDPDETLAREVTVKPRRFDHDQPITVTLRPAQYASNEWEVYDSTGTWLGTVRSYTGSLDRSLHQGSRIRVPGKRRTLWGYSSTEEHSGGFGSGRITGQVSRADCIRALVRDADREEL